MPRKKNDDSAPNLAFERTVWRPISPEAVMRVAQRYELGAPQEFEEAVYDWSCNYGRIRRMFRDIPSRADQRDIYKDLAGKLDLAFQALSNLGPTVKIKLSLCVDNDAAQEGVSDAVAMMMRNDAISKAGKPFPDSFDVDDVRDDIGMLKAVSEMLANSIERQLNEGATSLSPERNLDIQYLVSAVRRYFKAKFPEESTGQDFDPAGEHGPAGQTPLNLYTKFTVDCCALVEPTISKSLIRESMGELIARERSRTT